MEKQTVKERAFAMPLTSPSYPKGPYRFVDQEYLVITYHSNPEAIRAMVLEPLILDSIGQVYYEWINMPDSSEFGSIRNPAWPSPAYYKGRRFAGSQTCRGAAFQGRSDISL